MLGEFIIGFTLHSLDIVLSVLLTLSDGIMALSWVLFSSSCCRPLNGSALVHCQPLYWLMLMLHLGFVGHLVNLISQVLICSCWLLGFAYLNVFCSTLFFCNLIWASYQYINMSQNSWGMGNAVAAVNCLLSHSVHNLYTICHQFVSPRC